jgi:hypothetical protein
MLNMLLGNRDVSLCEANMEDDGASILVAGFGNVDGLVAMSHPNTGTDVAVPWSRVFDKTGTDVDALRVKGGACLCGLSWYR